jgi:hypothetical protein
LAASDFESNQRRPGLRAPAGPHRNATGLRARPSSACRATHSNTSGWSARHERCRSCMLANGALTAAAIRSLRSLASGSGPAPGRPHPPGGLPNT